MRAPVALLLSALLTSGCMSYASKSAPAKRASRGFFAGDAEASAGGLDLATTVRQVIRRGSQTVEVDDIAAAADAVEAHVADVGGYVENRATGEKRGWLTVRVPASSLDDALDAFAALGKETSRVLEAEDVTGELADLRASLANDIALRDRLQALLEKARTVEEALAIEAQLGRLLGRIAVQQARLERLQHDVSLSQINVRLERPAILGPFGYVGKGVWWGTKKLFVLRD